MGFKHLYKRYTVWRYTAPPLPLWGSVCLKGHDKNWMSTFQPYTGSMLTHSRWIFKPWETKICLKQNHSYFQHTHIHTHTHNSIPSSRQNYTQADNPVSQRTSSLALWPLPDRGSSWTGTHGCLEPTPPGELDTEDSLSALEKDHLSSSA